MFILISWQQTKINYSHANSYSDTCAHTHMHTYTPMHTCIHTQLYEQQLKQALLLFFSALGTAQRHCSFFHTPLSEGKKCLQFGLLTCNLNLIHFQHHFHMLSSIFSLMLQTSSNFSHYLLLLKLPSDFSEMCNHSLCVQ